MSDHGNSTADTTSSEKSETTLEATSTSDKPVHKWPIRPGVHVHVNGLHMLNNSSTSGEISGFTYGARNNSSVASDTASEKDRGVDESEMEKSTVARGVSTHNDMTHPQSDQKKTLVSEAIHNNSNAFIYLFFFLFLHDFLCLTFFRRFNNLYSLKNMQTKEKAT